MYHQETDKKAYRAPYEVKELTLKHFLAFGCPSLLTCYLPVFFPAGTFIPIWGTAVVGSWLLSMQNLLGKAVSRMDLLNDGKTVEVTFRMGGSQKYNIVDLYKGREEKTLLETWEEPFLFPVNVKGSPAFNFYGKGQEAIKDGELFRAIINGKPIKM